MATGLTGAIIALGNGAAGAAAGFISLADAQAKFDAQAVKTAADADILKQKIADLNAKLKETPAAAATAADAFGRVAGGLTKVSAQADHATDGLVGTAWTMEHATVATTALTTAQTDLIQALAKVADSNGGTDLWIGHLIAQLKAGELSFAEFQKEVNSTLMGLGTLGASMGNTAAEANALNTILDKFKSTAKDGWPGATTAPVSIVP